MPGKESTTLPLEYASSPADLIIEIGADYTNSKDYLEDAFWNLPLPSTNTTTTETPTTDENPVTTTTTAPTSETTTTTTPQN